MICWMAFFFKLILIQKLAPGFASFGILFRFRKGVFEVSLARLGFPFDSILIVLGIFWVPFWHRKPSLSAPESVKHLHTTADTSRRPGADKKTKEQSN